jgi:V/A-type H+-transporting ATPase subunit K
VSWELLGTLSVVLVLGISAMGSGIGMYIGANAAIGAAKKRFKANQNVPMLILSFVGFPLTLTIYGFIIMQQMLSIQIGADNAARIFAFAISASVVMSAIAIIEGMVGANASEALCETGKGAAFYIIILGILETVALFTMVFTITNLV